LVGDASKAKKILGWSPEISFEELIALMVDADLVAEGVLQHGAKN
jgi:GDPmannose 4,6-dehydratase